ncbi:transposase [Kitasatospora sp. NPDC057940]|uniref:IS110 family transposase n=1 Tax=Kitasatospora sp. NPDC057940 TaxID=3346285 RepID=UPI0036DDD4CD
MGTRDSTASQDNAGEVARGTDNRDDELTEVTVSRIRAGVDIGKEHHHCVVIDSEGERLLSRRVLNDEPARPSRPADVLLHPAAGEAGTGAEGADAVMAGPAQPHRAAHRRGAEHRTAQAAAGGRGAPAVQARLQPLGRRRQEPGQGGRDAGHHAVNPRPPPDTGGPGHTGARNPARARFRAHPEVQPTDR